MSEALRLRGFAFGASESDQAIKWLNNADLLGTARRNVKQPENAPLGLGGWYLTVYPVDSHKLYFCEARIDDCGRWVGCPNVPDWYVISNAGKHTRFRDYGRAARFFANILHRRNADSKTPASG